MTAPRAANLPVGTEVRAGRLLLRLAHGRKPWRAVGGARFSHAELDELFDAGDARVLRVGDGQAAT